MASPVFIFICLIMSLLLSISNSALLLPLTHSLSQFNTNSSSSTHHLLKSSSARSAARFHRHRHRHHQVSLPLSPGSDYTLSFSLASQTISLYMDTGSDVVWVPCHPFECILCDGEYSPSAIPLNITTSPKPTNCKSPACSAVHSSLPSSDLCAIAHCPLESIEIDDECKSFHCPPFYYAYGDGSFVAKLYEDTLSIPMSLLKLPKFTFGCAHTSLGEPIGVAGFGRGPLSLPAQLSPDIGNYFSYCLLSHSFHKSRLPPTPSPLILGRRRFKNLSSSEQVVYYSYTPMLNNPKHPYFYCVGLEAVSIGSRRIRAPQSLRSVDQRGNGGMVVDSGTTFTMLPRKFYNSVVAEFDARLVGSVYKRASRVEARIGLSPCYYYYYYDEEEDNNNNNNNNVLVPQLVLHFGGNSSIVMPRRNYFYDFFDGAKRRKVGCLMIMDGGDDGGGPAGLLGNYQQQGFEVVYDLEQNRIGFAKRKCASLWDTTLN